MRTPKLSVSMSSIPGADDIRRETLSNGMVLLYRANFQSQSVVVHGYVQAGSIFDSEELLGLADFTASALMRGTQRRTMKELFTALESAGASLGFDCATHTVGFSGQSLAEDLPLLLEILAECLRYPSFPAEQVERLRVQILTSLAIRDQDTSDMASLTFDQIVYARHPYGRPEEGFVETVQNIRLEDLHAFHQQHYGPAGMVLSVVGAVEPGLVVDQVKKVFEDWQNPLQPAPPSLPPLSPLKEIITKKVTLAGKFQADIVMGNAGPPRPSDDFLPASLGNNVLGQFGMMGRIGEAVREKAGLAYYASSSLSGGLGPGPWYISAGVRQEDIERAINLILQEVRRFVTEPVSDEELEDSKASFIGRLPLSLESNHGVASALLNLERYQLGLDYYRRFAHLVNQVSAEQILQVAQRYLDPDRLAIAIAGP